MRTGSRVHLRDLEALVGRPPMAGHAFGLVEQEAAGPFSGPG
jgi:hypothetical protein